MRRCLRLVEKQKERHSAYAHEGMNSFGFFGFHNSRTGSSSPLTRSRMKAKGRTGEGAGGETDFATMAPPV